ncbi:MAG: acetyl-CoA carboxylase carboxyl transferase subunit beta [Armatimonadetes bacterium]|nr:acetyl-CoA carboxylase carboxyl transferase subunit beta [Armatimonadota bacterium]
MPPGGWFSRHKPESDLPEGLWSKCERCERIVFVRDLERNLKVCPHCDYHHRLTAWERIEMLTEPGSFSEWDADLRSSDPLGFPEYPEKLEKDRQKTGLTDAAVSGCGSIGAHRVSMGLTDFRFRAGAMNSVVGERLTRAVERAVDERLPVLLVSGTGGGASMYEGILSLMQMPKTSVALARHHDLGLLFISLLTDPTMAGVYASWASLGDLTLAEPGATIGFTGSRVSKQAQAHVGRRPANYQTAEFQQDRGMVDRVVPRKDLKATLEKLLDWTA